MGKRNRSTGGKIRRELRRETRRIVRDRLGFDKLHPGQAEALSHLLAGRDTLAVMPTGSGKSAIYQVAAVQLPGPTIVVSPLIALQHDQVDSINHSLDVGEATAVNSSRSAGDREEALEDVQNHEVEFVFLAPEQLRNPTVVENLQQAKPSLFVVDEAHCISEWGHDFRPDYLRLHAIIEALGHPTVLALTATASPAVREEILERLGMRDPALVVRGFDRPNIWLGVRRYGDEDRKMDACLEEVMAAEKPGIVYTATRKHAEAIAAALAERGVSASCYHAGVKSEERETIQDSFMAGELDVIVATTAFGMGIDKRDVRFVFHYDIPGSVDAYYQEIGRGGRDGEPARSLLFYRPQDVGLQRFFASGGQIDTAEVTQVLEKLQQHGEPVDLKALESEVGFSATKLLSILNRLEETGMMRTLEDGQVEATEEDRTADEAAASAAEAQERHQRYQQSRVEMIRGYAETGDCRRQYLLNYFGETYPAPCWNCDNCDAGRVAPDDRQERPFALNSRVTHAKWGEGTVTHYEDDKITVQFETMGYKTLALDVVCEQNLLQAVD